MKATNFRPEDSEHNNLSPQRTGFTRGEGVTKGVTKSVNPDNGFRTLQLKPRFYLFQRIRDQLYLNPTLVEQTSSTGAYFGALGFTKLLEKLVLHAVPLQILLDWLSKPKGPNLVEASTAAAPDKALDVVTKEVMTKTGEPMTPLHFRGFRLHTVWTQQPGEDLVRQVAFPRFLGKATSSMLEYEPERFPQDLTQGQKMAINLRQPFDNHWNISSDLVLPLTIDSF